MTALNKYQRLETGGRWRESAGAEARDVVVSFGEATLVLTDPRTDIPLTHWSLPAVMRLNPGKMPARYAPGPDDAELLEVDDDLMISAIEKIHDVIEANRPPRGRLRGVMMLAALAMATMAAAVWGPSALLRHAADIAPPAQRAEIGRMVLAEVERSSGSTCSRPAGDMVRHRLAARLIGPEADIAILPTPIRGARRLPGLLTILGVDQIGEAATPETVAGHILAAQARAAEADPLLDALRYAGPRATLSLLTNGSLPPGALAGYGDKLLQESAIRPEDEPLLGYFARAGVSSEPYARALDPTGESVLGLIEANPFRTAQPRTILGERDWAALRQICDQ